MKAVFISRGCLLRNGNEHGLSDETISAVRGLAELGLYTVLLGVGGDQGEAGEPPQDGELSQRVVRWVSEGGGRIDALVHCPHVKGEVCHCWGPDPGLLWEAASDLDIYLEESYTICDVPADVLLACAAGTRPLLALNGRSIEALYDGLQPEPADFPVARDLARAVSYIQCEEDGTQQIGHPHPRPSLALEEVETLLAWPDGLAANSRPTVTAFTGVKPKEERPVQVVRYGGRMFALFVMGGIWLSLGIAYLLTHLYRVKPFPEFVWYLTLQFVPRPVRGALFMLTGVAVLWLALRSFRGMLPTALRWGKVKDK